MEAIWGPVNGFYVAAYAQQRETGEYVAYAKVCRREPADYWSADCLLKLFGGEHHGNEQAALLHMRRVAYAKISCIPPAAASMLDMALATDAGRHYLPLATAIRARVARASWF